ncbi:MAG: hypothetical protein EOO88_24565 [Pedobacter sp.]|nr:MAG: hypothetical protein EOO88_24565 [Pedobacter sp.]
MDISERSKEGLQLMPSSRATYRSSHLNGISSHLPFLKLQKTDIYSSPTIGLRKIMKKIYLVIALASLLAPATAQQVKLDEKATVTIHSSKENLDRTIYVQLPKNHGNENKSYPVIILFDAQDRSLFNLTSSVIDRLSWTNDIPEAIFVGVVQNNRSRELNFEQSEQTSSIFLDFVKNELLGYIGKNYKSNGYTTLIGHSLGGQFVTNAILSYPDVFNSAISISGAMNYPNKRNIVASKVIEKAASFLSERASSNLRRQKYYFSSGDDGFQDSGFKFGALKMDSLFSSGQQKSMDWKFELLQGYNHMTTPLLSIPAGLTFVYRDWHIPESQAMDVLLYHKQNPVSVLRDKQFQIAKSYGAAIALPKSALFQFAEYSLSREKITDAEIQAKSILEKYPNDEESYSLMASICIKKGDTVNAIKNYEKAQAKSAPGKYHQQLKSLKKQNAVTGMP